MTQFTVNELVAADGTVFLHYDVVREIEEAWAMDKAEKKAAFAAARKAAKAKAKEVGGSFGVRGIGYTVCCAPLPPCTC